MVIRKAKSKETADPTSIHIGNKIRERRVELGVSQMSLSEQLKISLQQVQKYEKGSDMIEANRLKTVAQILRVPISFFFDGLPIVDYDSSQPITNFEEPDGNETSEKVDILAFSTSAEGLRLNKSFVLIRDVAVRRRIIELVKSLSKTDNNITAQRKTKASV